MLNFYQKTEQRREIIINSTKQHKVLNLLYVKNWYPPLCEILTNFGNCNSLNFTNSTNCNWDMVSFLLPSSTNATQRLASCCFISFALLCIGSCVGYTPPTHPLRTPSPLPSHPRMAPHKGERRAPDPTANDCCQSWTGAFRVGEETPR